MYRFDSYHPYRLRDWCLTAAYVASTHRVAVRICGRAQRKKGNKMQEVENYRTKVWAQNAAVRPEIAEALVKTRLMNERCIYCGRDTYGEHPFYCMMCHGLRQSASVVRFHVPEWVQLTLPLHVGYFRQ